MNALKKKTSRSLISIEIYCSRPRIEILSLKKDSGTPEKRSKVFHISRRDQRSDREREAGPYSKRKGKHGQTQRILVFAQGTPQAGKR
jgi:hypothetical protein